MHRKTPKKKGDREKSPSPDLDKNRNYIKFEITTFL